MTDELAVEVEDRGTDVAISLTGELDFGTTPDFLDTVQPLAESGRALVLDLDQLRFCDSSGLGALVRLHQLAATAGGSLVLSRLQPNLASTLQMTMLHKLLTIRAD
ncbi:anti-sigma factor antagonist [Kribbella antibiotica]|uniref:Anti-sigma factor antagonist n=1 Tax=Kribbella antibiotica TaxID=190195 RepID=A0A4R4ZY47_9ACTN|nr:STAS domain-containing protein [Kribbella antibiotica]TDD63284.1 anti-sigma factor antagonist [Kribbella antibiotica]